MARFSFLSRLLLVAALVAGAARAQNVPVLSQALPAQSLTASGAVANVNLAPFFSNPAIPGTAVRISVILGDQGTGNIDVALTDQQTPLTVANFLAYVNSGSFSSNIVHRSVPGFVIQDGGYWVPAHDQLEPVGTMPPVPNEPGIANVRGTIAMAKLGTSSNSATSQWFINLVDNSANLDSQNGGFTVFGNVLGNTMTVADTIAGFTTYNETSVLNADFSSLPLTEPVLDTNYFIQTSIAVISGMTFAASAANGTLVTVTVSGNTLVLTPAAANTGSTTVTVTASALDGGQLSTSFTVMIAPAPAAPVFTASPVAAGVLAGQTANFAAAATGVPAPALQWQGAPPGLGAFSNLANGSDFAGVTTATLSVLNPTVAMSGTRFQCVAGNSVASGVASGAATLTVTPAPATVTLSGLTATFSGAALPVTVATNPAGLGVAVTYGSSATAPTNAGSYAVQAVVTDPNHTGSAAGTLVIAPAAATVTLSGLAQAFSGGAPPVTVATNPPGLGVTVLYDGRAAVPTAVGSYAVTATVSDPNHTGSAAGTLVIGPDFASFLAQYFTAAQLANPAVTGPTANPAGDGMPNLMKYALGLDPTVPDAAAGAPEGGIASGGLTLTYVAPPGITDVTYVVQVSGDLVNWSSGPGATQVVSTTLLDAKHEQVVVRDLTPASGTARRFMRLQVTQ
jgi:cyclophilin family peptidyl-prolyl cis-trans isomerase